jgi:hypothetical protein
LTYPGSFEAKGVLTLVPLLKEAAPILLNWPIGLHEWLSARKQPHDYRTGIRAEFGPWLGRLTRVLRAEGCEAIADEVRAWLALYWGARNIEEFIVPSPSHA